MRSRRLGLDPDHAAEAGLFVVGAVEVIDEDFLLGGQVESSVLLCTDS